MPGTLAQHAYSYIQQLFKRAESVQGADFGALGAACKKT
jgi:hypothetical protein